MQLLTHRSVIAVISQFPKHGVRLHETTKVELLTYARENGVKVVILERDALKWFKPAKGQFQIFYKLGTEQPEYIPDFVAEIDNKILMVETKARADIDTPEVQAKAAAAVRWCKHASDHAESVGGKPWHYLLVPHDGINEAKRLADFLASEVMS